MTNAASLSNYPRGWQLFPLIYSTGPGGIPGIAKGYSTWQQTVSLNPPFYQDSIYLPLQPPAAPNQPTNVLMGQPLPDSNGVYHYAEYIHNHRIEVK